MQERMAKHTTRAGCVPRSSGQGHRRASVSASLDACHARACEFRGLLSQLLEPRGITRANLAALDVWLDRDAFDLLDHHDELLGLYATGSA